MADIDKRDKRIIARFTEDMHNRITELAELYQQPASVLCANWIAEKVVSLENQKSNQAAIGQALVTSLQPMFEKMMDNGDPVLEEGKRQLEKELNAIKQ